MAQHLASWKVHVQSWFHFHSKEANICLSKTWRFTLLRHRNVLWVNISPKVAVALFPKSHLSSAMNIQHRFCFICDDDLAHP